MGISQPHKIQTDSSAAANRETLTYVLRATNPENAESVRLEESSNTIKSNCQPIITIHTHRIMESRLEESTEIIKSTCCPIINTTHYPCPSGPYLHAKHQVMTCTSPSLRCWPSLQALVELLAFSSLQTARDRTQHQAHTQALHSALSSLDQTDGFLLLSGLFWWGERGLLFLYKVCIEALLAKFLSTTWPASSVTYMPVTTFYIHSSH